MSSTPPNILFAGPPGRFIQALQDAGLRVKTVSDSPAESKPWAGEHFDAVVLDWAAAAQEAPETVLARLQDATGHLPLVILADASNEELASQLLRLGAQDVLVKENLTGPKLAESIQFAMARHHSRRMEIRSSYLLQALMDNIPDSIYFKDKESHFICINRALANKFGLQDPAHAIGKTDADFFKEAHARQALEDEKKVIQTGQPLVGIEEIETWADGKLTWVSTTKMTLRDQSGRIVGTFGMSRDITERKIAEEALAERTSQLQEKNQQIQEELKMAHELQLAMLPQNFPVITRPGFPKESALEFFSFYFPTGVVSGDFFDVVPLSNTSVGVFICDVMGHDMRAALVTAMMRALVEDLSLAAVDPGALLTQINRGLVGVFQQTGATMYATAFYLIADVARGRLRYASAGHPDPLHLRGRDGSVEWLKADSGNKKGPALGLFEDAHFPSYERSMEAGDLITLYTDGLIEAEAPNQEQYSQELLAKAMRRRAQMPAKVLLGELIDEIREFAGQEEFADDVCLVGIEVKWPEPVAAVENR